MTTEQILKLVEAGFTAEDIRTLANLETSAPEETQEESEQAESQDRETVVMPTETETVMTELVKEVKALKDSFTRYNLIHDEKPAPEKKSGEDVLVEFLNRVPEKKGE